MTELILFTGSFCAPCRAVKPIVKAFAEANNIPLRTLDLDYDETVFNTYDIRSIPALLVIKDGREHTRHFGLLSESSLNTLCSG